MKRMPVMYNDFVLIGPKSDPAKVAGGKDILDALKKIKAAGAPFVSRGDRSGTHMAELDLWKGSGIDIAKEKGPWYRDTGQGMGPALNTASSMNAYILADRGTWLSFKNRGDLAILVEGDKRLFNQYGVILVNPEKHPHVKTDLGQAFIDWVDIARGTEEHRRLQDRRRAAVLSQRQRQSGVMSNQLAGWLAGLMMMVALAGAAQEPVRLYAAGSLRVALTAPNTA